MYELANADPGEKSKLYNNCIIFAYDGNSRGLHNQLNSPGIDLTLINTHTRKIHIISPLPYINCGKHGSF